MHIAINTIPLTSGHKRRGIGLYTKNLIDALHEFEPSHTYTFFTNENEVHKDADVVHYPFFDPFFLTLPWSISKPITVTVHDLIPIVFAQHFPRGIRGQIKWVIQKKLLEKNATTIITDSQTSKSDIMKIFGYASSRVFSIPLAPRKIKIASDVRKKYTLNTKFILYVGDINWNKNIPGLFNAFDLYAKKSKEVIQLVCVGKAFTEHTMQRPEHVQLLGLVSDEDLAGLYNLAEALVYPSFAEGFGFPVLEALASGCPVVASDIPSLREIAGPSTLVDPQHAEDICQGITHVLSLSLKERSALIQKGLAWAKKFSWEKVAHETVAVYEKTLNYRTRL